jgi:hypothetical protein
MSMYTNIEDLPQSLEVKETNIEPVIKKRVRFTEHFEESPESPGIISRLISQINEDNILLFVVLLLTALPMTTQYINKLPVLSGYVTDEFMGVVIKASVMLLVYIIVKIIILPQIKL